MTDQLPSEQFPSKPEEGKGAESTDKSAASKLRPGNQAEVSTTGEPATPNKLTAEEQMALYEKDLKENDWGHQPC